MKLIPIQPRKSLGSIPNKHRTSIERTIEQKPNFFRQSYLVITLSIHLIYTKKKNIKNEWNKVKTDQIYYYSSKTADEQKERKFFSIHIGLVRILRLFEQILLFTL